MPRRYQTVEVTDLRSMAKSYKIFKCGGRLMDMVPVEAGIPTREQALARLRELEEAMEERRS